MRVLVCGDRDWIDHELILQAMIDVRPTVIIDGGARGADTCAELVAVMLRVDNITFQADWDAHGKAAGPIRNAEMLRAKPDIGLAFRDHIERSKGTKDMLARLKQARIPHLLITHHEDYRPKLDALLRSIPKSLFI